MCFEERVDGIETFRQRILEPMEPIQPGLVPFFEFLRMRISKKLREKPWDRGWSPYVPWHMYSDALGTFMQSYSIRPPVEGWFDGVLRENKIDQFMI